MLPGQGEAGSDPGQALQEQAEGRPEALQSSAFSLAWGAQPSVGGAHSQKARHHSTESGSLGLLEKRGGQEARELGDMGRSALLPGRGQRPRQRKGGVPPQAASPSGATRRAEQRLMGRRAWCILRTRGGQLPRRCSSQPAVGPVALLADRGASGSPWGPPSTSPGCRNPLRRWC